MNQIVYEPPGPQATAFLTDNSYIRGIMGPVGCVAGHTLVLTEHGPKPISEITSPIRVLSWDAKGQRFVLSQASSAFPKGEDYLYRVSTPQGEFDAAGHHRVLCVDGSYQQVQYLHRNQSLPLCSRNPLGSTSSAFLKWLLPDAQSSLRRREGFLARCARSARRYGQQLLQVANSGLFFSQQRADVHTLASLNDLCVSLQKGGHSALLSGRTRHSQFSGLKQTDDYLTPVAPLHRGVGGQTSSSPSAHSAVTGQQGQRSLLRSAFHPIVRLFSSCFRSILCSVTERPIVALERKGNKEIYWDLQVLDTNNYVTIDGAIHHNSGKSVSCCMDIFRHACEQEPDQNGNRRTRWAIIRNTYPELVTTTIKTWFEWIPRELGKWRSQGPPTHFLNFELPDGTTVDAEVMFLALDTQEDAKKLLSLELTGAWINEAREVPQAILEALVARIPRFPPKRDGGATWAGVIMDTNPPDTDSWWYRMAEEKTPNNAKFFRQPSGLSDQAENKNNLPESYYQNIIAVNSEDFVKVHVHGEYGFVMDGKPVYPEFKHSMHVQPIEKYKNAPLFIGIDFGLTPAAVICQRGPRGEWLVLGEVVSEDMGAQRFSEVLSSYLARDYKGYKMFIYGDPSGDNRAQTDEMTPFMILRKNGIMAVPAPSNDPVLRKEALRAPLSRLIDGIPGMRIDPECQSIIKGLAGGYHYKRMRVAGKDKFKDMPEKNMSSHVIEALEYAMLGAGEGRNVFGGSRTPKKIEYDNRGIV